MFDAVSAGHICIDLTPKFSSESKDIFVGGKLTNVGEMIMTTGGSVSNTGIALNILGLNVPLVAKVGDDILGGAIQQMLEESKCNTEHFKVSKGEASSYSVVLAPPGTDRIFLHNPGVNDTFTARDIDYSVVENARLFHLGYPTIMRQLFINDGAELVNILKKAKEAGATTSVDMTLPDPNSESGKADWIKILSGALKYTDIFMPSIEEIVYMLDREEYNRLKALDDDILQNIDIDYIASLGAKIIEMGAKIVVLKCGTLGYYVKTSGAESLQEMGRGKPADVSDWADKELFSGIYKVEDVKTATGAGDTSIAGFLASLLNGFTVEKAISVACAVGAICVTGYGATDAIVHMDKVTEKMDAGWEKRPVPYKGDAFKYDDKTALWVK